jgi:serine/threonine-protein kinase
MSPEQACGQTVDGRSDLFSLGCAMYHLITGRQAFPGDSPIERLGKRIKGSPVPITNYRPDLPSSLIAVLNKLMANNPADRYQKAEDAAEALSSLIRSKRSGSKVRPQAEAQPVVQVAPTPPQPPEVIRVEPEFPGWFRPFANLIEKNAPVALGVMFGLLSLTFALGIAVGKFLIR